MVILNKDACREMSLFHRDDIFERKAAGYVEVVQSTGHSVSLSFGAVSERGREGRREGCHLFPWGVQRHRGAESRRVESALGSEWLLPAPEGCGAAPPPVAAALGPGPGRSPCLARTRKPSPADAGETRLYICSISEKTRLGAGSVFTAAVPDGGGGLGSSASSQRVK